MCFIYDQVRRDYDIPHPPPLALYLNPSAHHEWVNQIKTLTESHIAQFYRTLRIPRTHPLIRITDIIIPRMREHFVETIAQSRVNMVMTLD